MSKRYDNLFTFIMEADDIPDFDPGEAGGDAMPDTAGDASPGTPDPASDGPPPEMAETDDNFDFNPEGEDTGNDMGGMDNPENPDEQNPDDNQEGENIGEKTNAILNERLYHTLNDRNAGVEATLDQLQAVIPILPYEIVKELDKPLDQLKTALSKGQSYAIDKFLNAEYGENLLFFEKLNSLYVLIEDKIDRIIKKAKKDKTS